MSDTKKNKEELLKEIFDNVNYWLAFAEAKNAGLLAVNIAVLALVFSVDKINMWGYVLVVIILFSTFFLFLALWSRFAAKWKNKDVPNDDDNLLYYRDITKYTEEDFLLKIHTVYFNESIENSDSVSLYIKNMTSEICINAKIATRKFELFNKALKIDIIALLIAIAIIIMA